MNTARELSKFESYILSFSPIRRITSETASN